MLATVHGRRRGGGLGLYWAHTAPSEGNGGWQPLSDHLVRTAGLARGFGARIGIPELAALAALLHDLGKYSDEFQEYLRASAALRKAKGPMARLGRTIDHKLLGAAAAERIGPVSTAVAPMIAGHHGGLLDLAESRALWRAADPGLVMRRARVDGVLSQIGSAERLREEVGRHAGGTSTEMLVRMTFSCLVDADALDTEAHDRPTRAGDRGHHLEIARLRDWLLAAQDALLRDAPPTRVNRVRAEVYRDCLVAAELPPGCFRLTVPTGGGKTRSSLAFALSHAAAHGLERVIYAIPYTSIIDQTVEVFREVLPEKGAVLPHHSGAFEAYGGNDDGDEGWQRLATDNWDAPVVVTTNVQFFESLLGSRPGRSRKLHRIARSVVVLDEVQTLPPALLDPMLDVLRCLAEEWGVTIVLCSATQPAVGELDKPGVCLPNVREIVRNPGAHFRGLERVEYVVPEASWTWERVAQEMRMHVTVLAIVNTRADALDLLDALDDPEALHLSTLLIPCHRKSVLDEVKRRLMAREPCRVVSTQVVEAGVDIDFPVVLRATGPLDSVIQAAGRCNREGRLERGRVVVFEPSEGHWSAGVYRTGTELARTVLRDEPSTLCAPETSTRYFGRLYECVDTDAKKIQRERLRCGFRRVDELFHLIADDTVAVLVSSAATELAERSLVSGRAPAREERRILEANSVSVNRRMVERLAREGLVAQLDVRGGLYRWLGARYDPVRGLGRMTEESGALIV